MKRTMIIIGIIFAIIVGIGLAKDLLIKSAVVAVAKSAAGVNVTIDKMSVSFFQQSVKAYGIKVYNPEGFSTGEVMADIPEVAVTMDVPTLFKNRLHLPYMRIYLKEVRVVKNKVRAVNVNSLKFTQTGAQQGVGKKAPSPEMKMQLDVVSLNIGRIVMEDYTSGKDKPRVTVLEINMKDREFRNIKSPAELGAAVLFQSLAPAGLDGLVSFGSHLDGKTSGKVLDVVGGLLKSFRN